MKSKILLITVSAAALAVYADCQAMLRRAPNKPARMAAPRVQRVPQRSLSFKRNAELFLEGIKKSAESHKEHVKNQLSEEPAALNQLKMARNQLKKDLFEGRISPQEIANICFENNKDRDVARELEIFKFGLSLELSEAEIKLCKATNNMKKYNSVDLDKLLKQHQELFIGDSLDVQMHTMAVWTLKGMLNSINEFHQIMQQDIDDLEKNAKFALADAVKNQKCKDDFKPKY